MSATTVYYLKFFLSRLLPWLVARLTRCHKALSPLIRGDKGVASRHSSLFTAQLSLRAGVSSLLFSADPARPPDERRRGS